jgi:hypothetical protein
MAPFLYHWSFFISPFPFLQLTLRLIVFALSLSYLRGTLSGSLPNTTGTSSIKILNKNFIFLLFLSHHLFRQMCPVPFYPSLSPLVDVNSVEALFLG